MGLAVVTVAAGGLPVVESTAGGTPVTEAANGRGVPVTKVVGKPGMPVVFETIGVVAPVTYATLDGVNSSQVTVSGGGLTATVNNSTNNIGARSTAVKNTGKFYFEMTAVRITGNSMGCGLITPAGTYTNMVNDATQCLMVIPTGTIFSNNTTSGINIGAYVTSTVLGFAIDFPLRRAWINKNGGIWNGAAIGSQNPATGLGGATLLPTVSFSPAVAFGGGAPPVSEAATANFGASAFVGAVPAGFTSGWPV